MNYHYGLSRPLIQKDKLMCQMPNKYMRKRAHIQVVRLRFLGQSLLLLSGTILQFALLCYHAVRDHAVSTFSKALKGLFTDGTHTMHTHICTYKHAQAHENTYHTCGYFHALVCGCSCVCGVCAVRVDIED